MNRYKFLIATLTAFLLVGTITSCDDYLDVNVDPNNPTIVSPDLILPVGQNYTAAYMHGDRRASHLGNMFMYNWSEAHGFSWYNDEFQYLVTTTFYAALFDQAYTRALKQYHLLTQLGPEENNYVAIGKIMKAYHFQLLVDFYGDIPYLEALGRSSNPSPAYDGAEAVYNDLLVQLTEAIAIIKEAEDDPTAVDVRNDAIFQGNMTNWIRFANSLKVRILTRMSGPDVATVARRAKITEELQKIADEGTGFITTNVIVNPGYLKEENKQNPFFDSFGQGPDGSDRLTYRATAATQYILDYLTGTNDPRIDFLYEKPATGHLGINQVPEPTAEYGYQTVSNIGPGLLKGPTMGSNIFSLAEHNFNLAELALKDFGGDPEQLYYAGIQASFAYLGLTNAAFTTYTTAVNPAVNYANAANKLQVIITQKWLAVNGITAEQSWFDYNRTGFPANLPISDEASTADRPVRLFYPASERSSNAGNVPAQPNAFTQKIFWAN